MSTFTHSTAPLHLQYYRLAVVALILALAAAVSAAIYFATDGPAIDGKPGVGVVQDDPQPQCRPAIPC